MRLLLPTTWWGRMRVEGRDVVPKRGPLLVVPNHDSQWDPVVVAIALRGRRQMRFLARANLWKIFGLAPILNGLRQIPIERGAGDKRALDHAIVALNAGEAICIFPEGRLSGGEQLRARSGVGRLLAACPTARIVLCAVEGTTDYAHFPRRPRVRVRFFEPVAAASDGGDEPQLTAARLLAEVRAEAPPVSAGRRRA